MSTIGYINISLEVFGGILSLTFILCLYITRPYKAKIETRYIRLLTCNTLLLFCDAAAWLFKGHPTQLSYYLVRAANLLVFILGYIMLMLFTHYLISFLEKNRESEKLINNFLYIMCGFGALAIVLVIISQFNHMYYFIDEKNIYHRSNIFWLSQLFGIIGMVLNVCLLVRFHKQFRRKDFISFIIYISLPVAALIFQVLFYNIAVLYLSTTICLLCMYVSLQFDVSQEMNRKELELEKSRTAVILSQIQPHFLYNSLVGIKQLCDTEPKKGSAALEHFSYYLRENLYSLSDHSLIPFEKEVDHVKNYLYLERMRFGERVNIRWDINAIDFSIPPMTLQLVVENAVRHGILKKDAGGTIIIKSEKSTEAFIITVIDDGAGFNPDAPLDKSRPHIGNENVSKRLDVQCKGKINVKSQIGQGTVVEIILPQGKSAN